MLFRSLNLVRKFKLLFSNWPRLVLTSLLEIIYNGENKQYILVEGTFASEKSHGNIQKQFPETFHFYKPTFTLCARFYKHL